VTTEIKWLGLAGVLLIHKSVSYELIDVIPGAYGAFHTKSGMRYSCSTWFHQINTIFYCLMFRRYRDL